jgi:NAD(P)H-dependent FMN reductase
VPVVSAVGLSRRQDKSVPELPRPPSTLHLAVIVGSTREHRFGSTVARWFVEQCASRTDLTIDLIELADVGLPAVLPTRFDAAVAAYSERIDRADAIVVVTPEYNHGYPASLKQAIDVVRREWHAKPIGFVSYGGTSGGLRAVEQLRQVFAELHAVTVRETVSFQHASQRFDPSGKPLDPDGCNNAAKLMLDQLTWWASALRVARTSHPYAA